MTKPKFALLVKIFVCGDVEHENRQIVHRSPESAPAILYGSNRRYFFQREPFCWRYSSGKFAQLIHGGLPAMRSNSWLKQRREGVLDDTCPDAVDFLAFQVTELRESSSVMAMSRSSFFGSSGKVRAERGSESRYSGIVLDVFFQQVREFVDVVGL